MNIEILDNEIVKGDYDICNKIPIDILDSEKTAFENYWHTYQERNSKSEKHIGQVYSLILVQWKQLLQDNIKQDTAWNPQLIHTTHTSYYT